MTELKLIHDITKVCYHPLPSEWVAEVTPEDEARGRIESCAYCPIALATARALQIPAGIIDITGHARVPLYAGVGPGQACEEISPAHLWGSIVYQPDKRTHKTPGIWDAFKYIGLFDLDEIDKWPSTEPKRFHYTLYKSKGFNR